MPDVTILIALSDPAIGYLLGQGALQPAGFNVIFAKDRQDVEEKFKRETPDLVILSETLNDSDGLTLAEHLLQDYPQVPVLFLPYQHSEALAYRALQAGVTGYLTPPAKAAEVLASIRKALKRRQKLVKWARQEGELHVEPLKERLCRLEALQRVSRQISASHELDTILSTLVAAAVEISAAEEGSLLLVDEISGELYIRASRNFKEDFVRTFRIPTQDTLAEQAIQTGKPVLFEHNTPGNIKTSLPAYSLVYVPIVVKGNVIGVLEVDNRKVKAAFKEEHVQLLSALADHAAIAIENAHLFTQTEMERKKLETLLTKIDEGIMVMDHEQRLLFINPVARHILGIDGRKTIGKKAIEVIQQQDLIEVVLEEKRSLPSQAEINLDDGRVFNAQLTPIPEVGLAVTMQDITHLKELDHIKSDFVNSVSHDLRSPLTAILGYIELLDRVGTLNEQQAEFVRRVRLGVNNITTLIDDLLDLGRIEAGFDSRKEIIAFNNVIQYAVEGLKRDAIAKSQKLVLDIPANLPHIFGNPLRLRQMVTNLISNAIKYTPVGGRICVRAYVKSDQLILEVSDNGMGIAAADQPYIFDKFYRGENTLEDIPGTGLGLAIVKSIVNNHQGRIWVESQLGKGSTFTVVLPKTELDL
jgi:two-component system phosphate regulon sensor histidine kinase PhoR